MINILFFDSWLHFVYFFTITVLLSLGLFCLAARWIVPSVWQRQWGKVGLAYALGQLHCYLSDFPGFFSGELAAMEGIVQVILGIIPLAVLEDTAGTLPFWAIGYGFSLSGKKAGHPVVLLCFMVAGALLAKVAGIPIALALLLSPLLRLLEQRRLEWPAFLLFLYIVVAAGSYFAQPSFPTYLVFFNTASDPFFQQLMGVLVAIPVVGLIVLFVHDFRAAGKETLASLPTTLPDQPFLRLQGWCNAGYVLLLYASGFVLEFWDPSAAEPNIITEIMFGEVPLTALLTTAWFWWGCTVILIHLTLTAVICRTNKRSTALPLTQKSTSHC